jgi:hypothetical protein
MKRNYQPSTFKSAKKCCDVVSDTYFPEGFSDLKIPVFDITKI